MPRKPIRTQDAGNGNPEAADRREVGNGEALTQSDIPQEDVAARAYEIYEREGRGEGRHLDHWYQAEAELRAERTGQGSRTDQTGERPQPGSVAASEQNVPRSARRHQAGAGA